MGAKVPTNPPMSRGAILTANQNAFVALYVKDRNASEAYRKAYNCVRASPNTVAKAAYDLMQIPHVRGAVEAGLAEERRAALEGIEFTVKDALVALLEVASADPNELIGLRVGCCRYCHGDGHRYQWREREYLEAVADVERRQARLKEGDDAIPLPDPAGGFDYDHTRPPHDECPECRGEGVERIVARDTTKLSRGARMLYRGVKRTNNGIEILLADQGKALENAIRIIGGFDDKLNVSLKGAMVAAPAATTEEAVSVYNDLIKAGASVDSIVKK